MILPIYLYGNPVLRKKSEDITKDYPNIKQLIADMFETMINADGVGLAAPQIGKNINLIVIDTKLLANNNDKEDLKNFRKVFINPKFIKNLDNQKNAEEGCLSVPDIHENVSRYTDIEVTYFNENFEEIIENLEGYTARIFQHEFDHLQGVIYTDKINILRKKMINNRLNSIAKGKVKTNYKSKN